MGSLQDWQVGEDEAEVPTTMYSKVMPWILWLDIKGLVMGPGPRVDLTPFLAFESP